MDFEKEWLLHFANNISKSLLKKRVIGGVIFFGTFFLGRLLIKISF